MMGLLFEAFLCVLIWGVFVYFLRMYAMSSRLRVACVVSISHGMALLLTVYYVFLSKSDGEVNTSSISPRYVVHLILVLEMAAAWFGVFIAMLIGTLGNRRQ